MGAPPGALPWRVRCMAGDLFLRYSRRLLGGILTGFDRDYQAISRAYWCLTQSTLNAHSGYAHKRFEMYAAFSNRLRWVISWLGSTRSALPADGPGWPGRPNTFVIGSTRQPAVRILCQKVRVVFC
jgi:hypothetical protein